VVTEIVDVSADLAIDPRALWGLLVDPETYPRLFPGIGACEPYEIVDGPPAWQMRIGGAETEIRTLEIRLIENRELNTLELQCPAMSSFAAIRLLGAADRTHVVVTCVAPGRVHPLVQDLSSAAVTEWITAGLGRLVDLVRGAQTSVVTNGEDSTMRTQADVVRQMMATGVLRTFRPDRMIKQVGSLVTWGFTLAGGYAAGAGYAPHRTALIDDRGESTFAEIHARTQALASALAELGIGPGDAIGLLARNHTEMVEITTAGGKLGVDTILLTTGLSTERIAAIAEIHQLAAIFVDPELEGLLSRLPSDLPCYTTHGRSAQPGRAGLADLIDSAGEDFDKPAQPGRLIVLTSGTGGPPKVTLRPQPRGFSTIAALLSRLPVQMNETLLIPTPLFHSWGLAALHLSLPLRATVVLLERFDAEECLRLIAEHRVSTLIVFPIMVQQLLDLPAAVRARYDTSSLRMVASGGAALAPATVLRFMDTFGEILYNVYGSTEVSWATIADPADLRVSPATAGRPPLGAKIAVLDEDSRPLPVGATGRIFVGHHMLFDGYTDVPMPAQADGMLYSDDLGYLDATGRLFIAGRDDEMILSGGESVFSRPVEDVLLRLPRVSDVAVIGVPDREFGQRLAAFVVTREGAGLDPDLIRTYVRHRLGRYSVPREITFLDSLPRNAAGMVLKRVLIRAL